MQKALALGGLPPPQFQVRLSESEVRARFPELIAKLESVRPPATETPTPRESATAAPSPSSAPPAEPRVRLQLRELKEGEQFAYGTVDGIECRASGIVIVLRTAAGSVRASAANFAAVDFVTFRSTSQASVSCGTQPPTPARLIARSQGSGQMVAVALELLPDGYVP
jgi:hypothetical protein